MLNMERAPYAPCNCNIIVRICLLRTCILSKHQYLLLGSSVNAGTEPARSEGRGSGTVPPLADPGREQRGLVSSHF